MSLGAPDKPGTTSSIWEQPESEGSFQNVSFLKKSLLQRTTGLGLLGAQLSPAVARSGKGSHVLRRRSEATERIQSSLAALDEIVSTPPKSSLPPSGSLLKEPVLEAGLASFASPSVASTAHLTPLSITARELYDVETPKMSESIFYPDQTMQSVRGEHSRLGLGQATPFEETQHDVTMEEPAIKTGKELLHSFHQALQACPDRSDVLELISSFEKACQEELDKLKGLQVYSRSTYRPPMMTELNLERSTWQLIGALYGDRIEHEQYDDAVEHMDLMASDRSDKELVSEFFERDSSVRQAQLVVDWLEKNALSNLEDHPSKINYFADTITWDNTLYDLQRNVGSKNMVTCLDIDAPTREGKHLSDLDEKDELSFSKHLFACICAGQLSKAQDLCVECGQPWKAAVLEGWKLLHDPNKGKRMDDELLPIEGNLMRTKWKLSCWEMLKDPDYNLYEKAVFSALCGNLRLLLPACQSWLDYTWAYFKVMVDVLTEQSLRSVPRPDEELDDLPSEYWTVPFTSEAIFREIDASPSPLIQKQRQEHFYQVQKLVILDDLKGLVTLMHGWVMDKNKPLTIHQLRFLSHLVIFITGLGVENVEEEKCTEILETFVRSLTHSGYHSLVALYAARIDFERQIRCYAELLEGINVTDEQKKCLELGREAGLDIAAITKSVVENIRNMDPQDVGDVSALELGREMDITKADRHKIEVISWLVFEESQREEAIKQGNALIRAFLAMRKHVAAREVFHKIPPNSIEVIQRNWRLKVGNEPLPLSLSNDIREYTCIKTYLDAIDAFNAWFQHFHHKKPAPPTQPLQSGFSDQVVLEQKLKHYHTEIGRWEEMKCTLIADVEEKITNVLCFVGGGWMVDQSGPDNDDSVTEREDSIRTNQMVLLRKLCIPQLTLLLHSVLHSSGMYAKCLKLADLVAADKFCLYQEFSQDELQKLLQLLHKSAVALASDTHQDVFGYDF